MKKSKKKRKINLNTQRLLKNKNNKYHPNINAKDKVQSNRKVMPRQSMLPRRKRDPNTLLSKKTLKNMNKGKNQQKREILCNNFCKIKRSPSREAKGMMTITPATTAEEEEMAKEDTRKGMSLTKTMIIRMLMRRGGTRTKTDNMEILKIKDLEGVKSTKRSIDRLYT